jgi:hypothetical protein
MRAVIFDGRWHIAGQRLGRVVIESEQGGALGVVILAEASVADDRQRMGDARGLHAVLAQVLLMGVAHKRPAVDIFEPRYHCEKVACHYFASVFLSTESIALKSAFFKAIKRPILLTVWAIAIIIKVFQMIQLKVIQ